MTDPQEGPPLDPFRRLIWAIDKSFKKNDELIELEVSNLKNQTDISSEQFDSFFVYLNAMRMDFLFWNASSLLLKCGSVMQEIITTGNFTAKTGVKFPFTTFNRIPILIFFGFCIKVIRKSIILNPDNIIPLGKMSVVILGITSNIMDENKKQKLQSLLDEILPNINTTIENIDGIQKECVHFLV